MLTGLDGYSFRARWLPCVLVASPLALALVAWVPTFRLSHWLAVPLLAAVAAAFSGLARRKGRALELRLWAAWGGAPTSHVMRRGSDRITAETLQRLRRKIAQAVPDAPLPTPEEVTAGAAHLLEDRYAAVTRALIIQTRDKKEFGLVYAENVNYGFWRNLRALCGVGRGLSVVAFLIAGARLALLVQAKTPPEDLATTVIAMVAAVASYWFFRFWVSDELVKQAGFDYADRLVEASEQLVASEERRTQGHKKSKESSE
jgi:hypothetical protein